ncbi:MAG TPA: hypothetical protein PKD99_02435 [Sphingopyxis sp.]|nr:hypothetical protein [Sphingopyxis sp.]HMP43935.1 hypothetical protein [Sphingopyxis sp.]HMQ20028.1 hypothetical protein [Sphingopyxis sp.]
MSAPDRYPDSFFDFDDQDYERREEERIAAIKQSYLDMPPDKLGAEWNRHCRRHDSAVDRCEEINSPTIEDAAAWMRFIEREFERRGLSYHDYLGREDD